VKGRIAAFVAIVATTTFLGVQAGHADEGAPGATTLVGKPAPIVVSDAEREDLAMVAETLGIGFDEAIERFSGQELFAAAVDQLRLTETDTFSTALWEAGDGYKAVISFHGVPSRAALDTLSDLPFRVLVRSDARASEADLIAAQAVAREAVAGIPGVAAADSVIDDRSGEVVVTYSLLDRGVAATEVARVSDAAVARLTALSGRDVPVRTVEGFVPTEHQTAIVGGNGFLTCTAGFTVTSSGATGISTAGHCLNNTTYYGGSYAYFVAQSAPANGDVQWHTFNGAAVTNKFRYTSGGGERFVTSTANPVNGSAICYWGMTTGSHCGTVTAVNYCSPGGYCLLFRYGPSTADHGDSGGPWYFGNVGKGITQGYLTNGLGFRVDDMATRVGALNLLGLVVKVTP
jgi:hypothetical protein